MKQPQKNRPAPRSTNGPKQSPTSVVTRGVKKGPMFKKAGLAIKRRPMPGI